MHFLPGCWTQAFPSWLSSGMHLASPESVRKKNQQDRSLARPKPIFCDLISEMTSHHFLRILLLRRKLLGPDYFQGENISQGPEYQRVGITGSHLRDFLPQIHRYLKSFF